MLVGAPDDPAWRVARAQVEATLVAAFGPLILFEDEPAGGPDRALAAPAWGRAEAPGPPDGRWLGALRGRAEAATVPLLVRGVGGGSPEALEAALATVEGVGAGYAVWHDGFATDAWALRDAEGEPGPLFRVAAERIWPVGVAGRLLAFGPDGAGGWFARWRADGRGAGLSHFALHGQGPFEATLEPDGPFDWFAGYDPVTDEISVFVEGAPGEVELRLTP